MERHRTFIIKKANGSVPRKRMTLNIKKELQSHQPRTDPRFSDFEERNASILFKKDLSKTQMNSVDSVTTVSCKDTYLEVPMLDCLRLVEKYMIEMFKGKGRVDMKNSFNVLESIYEKMFRKENIKIKRNIKNLIQGNPEFKLIVESLKEFKTIQMVGEKPVLLPGQGFQKHIKDIDYFAQVHFPLCMYEMYRTFKRDKHLKHMGRLQFILFMRGMGFKVEDLIKFFTEIVKSGPASKKVKEYVYAINHAYGLTGSKTEYSGMGCPKIISLSRPSKGDVHGCPFDYFGDQHLFKLLNHKLGNEREAQEVVEARSLGAKFGCRKYFCKKNKIADIEDLHDGIGRHPNTFFAKSYYKNSKKSKKEKKPEKIQIEVEAK